MAKSEWIIFNSQVDFLATNVFTSITSVWREFPALVGSTIETEQRCLDDLGRAASLPVLVKWPQLATISPLLLR